MKQTCLSISYLLSLSTVILKPKKRKICHSFTFSTSICCEVTGPDAMIFIFWKLSFNPAFSLSSFTFIKRIFSSSSLSASKVLSSAYQLLIFPLGIWMQPVIHPPWHFASCALHISCISTGTACSQSYSFPNFETIYCSMSSSNSISWPAYKFLRRQVRWPGIPISSRIFHKFLWSTQSKTFHSQWSRTRCILEVHPPPFFFFFFFWLSNGCWQFVLWFLCFFEIQFVHLEVLSSHTADYFEGFSALPC